MTLGRIEGNIRFESDTQISRLHCRFYVAGGSVFVEDLDSTNRTLVNRVPITPRRRRRVLLNDVIKVGRQRLILTRQTHHQPPGSQDETSCHRVQLTAGVDNGMERTHFIPSHDLRHEPAGEPHRHTQRSQRDQRAQEERMSHAQLWGERLVHASLAIVLAGLSLGSVILLLKYGH